MLIAGIGRFGQVVNRLVNASGFKTTVLDSDLETIELIRKFGFKSFFGDPTRPDILHAAGIDAARVLVVAIDDDKAAVQLVQLCPLAAARPDHHRAGPRPDACLQAVTAPAPTRSCARCSIPALRAGRYVLEEMGLSEYEAHEAETTFYQMDRHAMLELAELWDPDVPITQNAAYIERAKALNKDLEYALMSLFTGDKEDAA